MSELDREARLEEILKQLRQKKSGGSEQEQQPELTGGVYHRPESGEGQRAANIYRAPRAAFGTGSFSHPEQEREKRPLSSFDTAPFARQAPAGQQGQSEYGAGEEQPQGDSGSTMVFRRENAPAPRSADTRSLLKALSGEPQQQEEAINKSALAPTIMTGIDEINREIEEEQAQAQQEPEEPAAAPQNAEEHPVFTTTFSKLSFIPEETPEQRQEVTGTINFEDTGAELDRMAEQIARKGVLNVQENAEDEKFKTFFSDTVIIDDKPLRGKARRARRHKDIQVAGEQDDTPQQLFEEEQPEPPEDGVEYNSRDDIDSIQALLMSRRGRAVARTVFTSLIAAVLIYLNVASEYSLYFPDILLRDPAIFPIINAAGVLAAILINAVSVFTGFGRLIAFKADSHSVTSFAAIAALVESVSAIALSDGSTAAFCAPVACAALAFSALGDAVSARRVLGNFKVVSEDYVKYSAAIIPDEQFTRRLTRELNITDAAVLVKRKTGFVEGFMSYSESPDLINRAVSVPASIVFLLSLVTGGIAYLNGSDFLGVVRTIALSAALSSPFMATLASAMPMSGMQKYLWRLGSVVPGYEAVDEMVSANCVVMEGREIFPKGNVMLHGIKTFEKERIDKAILYAASVLIQSCDTMAHVFLNVIQGKTEMLYDVDSVVYEDGLGFSFWVDQNRVLLGKRELLQSHEIEVPSRDYENRYTKKSTRDAIYLAVSGKLYAMFVVSYAPNAEVEKALRGFEREGVSVLVRTRDFNVTAQRIANMYHIPRSMVSVVSESDIRDLQKMTEYVGRARSALIHIGTISSFVGGILACYNLRSALKMTTAIELACMLVGATLALGLCIFSAPISGIITSVLGFQFCWLVVSALLAALRRY